MVVVLDGWGVEENPLPQANPLSPVFFNTFRLIFICYISPQTLSDSQRLVIDSNFNVNLVPTSCHLIPQFYLLPSIALNSNFQSLLSNCCKSRGNPLASFRSDSDDFLLSRRYFDANLPHSLYLSLSPSFPFLRLRLSDALPLPLLTQADKCQKFRWIYCLVRDSLTLALLSLSPSPLLFYFQ